LTDTQRTYLLERYSEGLTVTEIAVRHGIDKSVASRTISRAKANLRSYLEFCF
jgi:DNA-directed RNA polymerase specialized sigma24 family protein